MSRIKQELRRWWWIWALLALLGGYWLLPIPGQVVVTPGDEAVWSWPQMRLDFASFEPGQAVTLRVTDVSPWSHVLLTINGRPVYPQTWQPNVDGTGVSRVVDDENVPRRWQETWTWEWAFVVPDEEVYSLVFYRDCHTGCLERGRMVVGEINETPEGGLPTKLGVVFANPARDWHGRSGWDVELTYARLVEEPYWGIDGLAARVHQAAAKGLRILVRVDYDQGQSVPSLDDYLALTEYLDYLQRLARDERLQSVYGYFLGSGFNTLDSNSQSPERPVSPAWYARVFNGYGKDLFHTDNAVQVIRAENPHVRILVGPVRPWSADQGGGDAPWLDYMNMLAAALDEGARAKAVAGIPLAAPDGFALHVPGHPEAAGLAGHASSGAEDPRLDLRRAEWGGAQAGFRVYRDWLSIINAYPTTRGAPAFIVSTNTSTPGEGVPPAQNYPSGWLTTALDVINEEPQVQALCWFLDYFPHDTQWEWFSLTRRPGRMLDAAEEFDALLQNGP